MQVTNDDFLQLDISKSVTFRHTFVFYNRDVVINHPVRLSSDSEFKNLFSLTIERSFCASEICVHLHHCCDDACPKKYSVFQITIFDFYDISTQ